MNYIDYRERIAEIRTLMLQGQITVQEARVMAEPVIAEMNKRGMVLAREYNQKYKPLSFASIFR